MISLEWIRVNSSHLIIFRIVRWWLRRYSICLAMRETRVRFLGQEDPLEKEMASHSSTLAWKIPWTEESDTTERLHFTTLA